MSAPDVGTEEFLAEAEEILDRIADDLGDLERSAAGGEPDPEAVNSIFRGAHSLKGIAGMCGFGQITEVSHKMETLLDALRMGRVACTREVMDLLYETVDLLKGLCGRLARGEAPEDPGVPGFVERLVAAAEGGEPPAPGVMDSLGLAPDVLKVLTEYEVHRLEETVKNPRRSLVRVRASFPFESFDTDLEALNRALKACGEIISTLPSPGDAPSGRMDFDLLVGLKGDPDEARRAAEPFGAEVEVLAPAGAPPPPGPPPPGDSPPPPGGPAGARCPVAAGPAPDLRSMSRSIRVDLGKLDTLMNLVGELVLARSHVHLAADRLREQVGASGELLELAKAQKALDRKLSELQQAVMDVRMVPVGQLFAKLQRVIRKILQGTGKEVDLEIQGAETELDKLIVEDLSDPLVHVIRNAVDHGIEEPEVREAAGKPPRGRIRLAARQRGNHVVIEVEDDGAGVSRERVRRKAVERGLVEPDAVLDDREVFDLLFAPGFSTKDEATELSGRGVGMDVLRKNIARLSGMIELWSEEGRGTRVTIVLPITLAIIPALIVEAGPMRLAVPLASVLETLAVDPGRVGTLEGRPVLRLREGTLPLVRLEGLLGAGDGRDDGWRYAVVVAVAEKRVAFGVDDLVRQQDVVIKSLGRRLQGVPGIAGATDLGDREPILVADVASLVEEVFGNA